MSQEPTGRATVVTDDGSRIDIETKRFTVICHQGDIDITDILPADGGPAIVEIGPDHTLQYVAQMHPKTYEFFAGVPWLRERWLHVIGAEGKHDVTMPETIEAMRKSGLAHRHVFGLLCRLAEVVVAGHRPFIKLPESYLHPAQQFALADTLIRLTSPPKDENDEQGNRE
jgi:hypothetical protein